MSNREIIDESDVYIDVHKAIRRLTPAPKARIHRQHSQSDEAARLTDDSTVVAESGNVSNGHDSQHKSVEWVGVPGGEAAVPSSSPKTATFMMRRSSAGADGQTIQTTIPVRANIDELRQHLKHLGPSNPATNPKNTRSTTVKVKPGHSLPTRSASVTEGVSLSVFDDGDETTSLLRPQVTGKDGIQALRQSYGSVSPAPAVTVQLIPHTGDDIPTLTLETAEQVSQGTQTFKPESLAEDKGKRASSSEDSARGLRADSHVSGKKAIARSGSITENVIESRGVRKVVLETTSSNDEDEFAVVTTASSPEQSKAAPARISTGFFSRDLRDEPAEEGENEGLLSPDGGEEDQEPEGDSKGDGGRPGSSSAASGKKKNRRKKRKGGKS